MPSIRIDKLLNNRIYFLTFTIKRWYYLFDRHNRWDILLDSLQYCQKHKNLRIYSWVFMINHIHLIAQGEDMSGFVRDFKTFTSKELKKNIASTELKVLTLFEEDGVYQFWQKTNMPELIESEEFYNQKVKYVEKNPVRKFYVKNPEDWIWSSANKDGLLALTTINV